MESLPVLSVGIRELRQNASRYVDRAAAGERVAVSKRGHVVAYLVPATASEGPVGELVAAGIVAPPVDPTGDVTDIETAPAPVSGPSVTEALRQLRDDERW
jgi:prevent-host-death family protein